MKGQGLDLRGRQALADPQHHIARIVAALALPPLVHLLGEIARRLAAERRVSRAQPLAGEAVARRAAWQPARRIAAEIERRGRGGWSGGRHIGHGCIISRDHLAMRRRQTFGDRHHFRMAAPPVGIGFELALEIAEVEPGQAGRAGAGAPPVEAGPAEAGCGRARVAPGRSSRSRCSWRARSPAPPAQGAIPISCSLRNRRGEALVPGTKHRPGRS